jgi:hypothetical protein
MDFRNMRTLSKDELRSFVSEWTLILKAEGVPPEKVLVTVKTLVRVAIAPRVASYDGVMVAKGHTALMTDASQCCIDVYFNEEAARLARARSLASGTAIARKSLSRRVLLKLLVMQPELVGVTIASRLSLNVHQLATFASGTELMPLEVQEHLAEFVLKHEPRLGQLARRLNLQIQASRRYHAGDVVRHLTSRPNMS